MPRGNGDARFSGGVPPSPPSGPRSMTQSAVFMTSRLCSMTTTVFPCAVSRWSTSISLLHVLEV